MGVSILKLQQVGRKHASGGGKMSQFTEGLITKWVPEEKKFRVYLAFGYHVGSEDSDEIIEVPEGYMSDLASIPWFARWLIPKLGRHAQAAVLHDIMYQYHLYSQKRCDEIFLEAMEVLKVPLWKRRVMYRALRIGGWVAYNRYSNG